MRRFVGKLLAVVVVAVACTLGASVSPASAQTQPTIFVAANETKTITYRPLVGANYQQGRRPAACAAPTRQSCDTIPIRLEVPADLLKSGEYVLSVKTIWNVKLTVRPPAMRDKPSDDQVNTFLYTDPPRVNSAGTQIEETYAFLTPPPTLLTINNPQTTDWVLTVENMYGINEGYTLEVSLVDLGGGPGADLSEDEGATFDFSDDSSVGVTPSFDGDFGGDTVTAGDLGGDAFFGGISGDFLAGSAGGALTLDMLDVQGDAELDAISGIEGDSVLSLGRAEEIERVSSGPPVPRSASPLVLALWFLLVPGVLAGGAMFIAVRRRQALTA